MNFSTCHCSNRPRLQPYKKSTCVVRCFFYAWKFSWRVWSSLFQHSLLTSTLKASGIRQKMLNDFFDPCLWFCRNFSTCLGYLKLLSEVYFLNTAFF
jgi:hypothetical protein